MPSYYPSIPHASRQFAETPVAAHVEQSHNLVRAQISEPASRYPPPLVRNETVGTQQSGRVFPLKFQKISSATVILNV